MAILGFGNSSFDSAKSPYSRSLISEVFCVCTLFTFTLQMKHKRDHAEQVLATACHDLITS